MNINKLLSIAKKNAKNPDNVEKIVYSTAVGGPQKLQRSVNPNAVKAVLQKKKDEERKKVEDERQKKAELLKLREQSNKGPGKKRKSPNQVGSGRQQPVVSTGPDERFQQQQRQMKSERNPDHVVLSSHEERQHKAFMKKLTVQAAKASHRENGDVRNAQHAADSHRDQKKEKREKKRKKAKVAVGMDYKDLLKMAEKHKNEAADSEDDSDDADSSSGSDGESSDDDALTPQQRYEKERMKRKKLEAALKMMQKKGGSCTAGSHKRKHPATATSNDGLPGYKIGKLDAGTSEESKRERARALAKKFASSKQSASSSGHELKTWLTDDRPAFKPKPTADGGSLDRRKTTSPVKRESSPRTNGFTTTKIKPATTTTVVDLTKQKSSADRNKSPHGGSGAPKTLLDRKKEIAGRHGGGSSASKTHLDGRKEASSCGSASKSLSDRSKMPHNGKNSLKKPLDRGKTPPDGRKISKAPLDRRKDPPSGGGNCANGSRNPGGEKLKLNPYANTVIKQKQEAARRNLEAASAAGNPYAKVMMQAKKNMERQQQQQKAACTVSVTTKEVRTNYPGVAETDPHNARYHRVPAPLSKSVAGSRRAEMEERRRRAMEVEQRRRRAIDTNGLKQRGLPQTMRRGIRMLGDDFDDDDDEDPDMDGFIVDEDDELDDEEIDVSKEIGSIFGYDRSKYARESEYDLACMDASYRDIEKEEKRSARIAREEDAREERAERERQMRKNRKKAT